MLYILFQISSVQFIFTWWLLNHQCTDYFLDFGGGGLVTLHLNCNVWRRPGIAFLRVVTLSKHLSGPPVVALTLYVVQWINFHSLNMDFPMQHHVHDAWNILIDSMIIHSECMLSIGKTTPDLKNLEKKSLFLNKIWTMHCFRKQAND